MDSNEQSELQELRKEVAALRAAVADLVEAWNTAKGVVRFVKWIGSMAIGITSIWALIKLGNQK